MLSYFFLFISNIFFSSSENRHCHASAVVQSLKAREVPVPERLKIEVIFSNQQSQKHSQKNRFYSFIQKII